MEPIKKVSVIVFGFIKTSIMSYNFFYYPLVVYRKIRKVLHDFKILRQNELVSEMNKTDSHLPLENV